MGDAGDGGVAAHLPSRGRQLKPESLARTIDIGPFAELVPAVGDDCCARSSPLRAEHTTTGGARSLLTDAHRHRTHLLPVAVSRSAGAGALYRDGPRAALTAIARQSTLATHRYGAR